MIKDLILEADRVISKHCKEKTDDECWNNGCKYGISLGEEKGYLCTKVFQLSAEYSDK